MLIIRMRGRMTRQIILALKHLVAAFILTEVDIDRAMGSSGRGDSISASTLYFSDLFTHLKCRRSDSTVVNIFVQLLQPHETMGASGSFSLCVFKCRFNAALYQKALPQPGSSHLNFLFASI